MSAIPAGFGRLPVYDEPQDQLERLHRYCLAANLLHGRVLDLGCGAGYGSYLLVRRTRRVLGLDRSVDVVAHARETFGQAGLDFMAGDCLALPFADSSFDGVVCFGVLDEVAEPERLIAELHRVLSPKGVALLSAAPGLGRGTGEPALARLVATRFRHFTVLAQRRLSEEWVWTPLEGQPPGASGLTPRETGDLLAVCVRRARHGLAELGTRWTHGNNLEVFFEEVEELRSRAALTESEAVQLRRDLSAIKRSKMWRMWMFYQSMRRRVVLFPRGAGGAKGGLAVGGPGPGVGALARRVARRLVGLARGGWRGVARLAIKVLRRVARAPAHAVGWIYLLVLTAATKLRAGLRRRRLARGEKAGTAAVPPPAAAPAAPAAIDQPEARPRVLIVSPYSMYPPDHGGGVRLYNLVRRLAGSCDLYALVFNVSGEDPVQRRGLEPYCRGVYFHRWRPRYAGGALSLDPPNAQLFWSEQAALRIRDIVYVHGIDIVQIEYTELGQYARGLDDVEVILTEHDIAFRQHQRRRQLSFQRHFPEGRAFGASFGDWMRLLRYERGVCRAVDQIHVMSRDDGDFLAAYLPDGDRRIRVVPNAVDTAHYRPRTSAADRRGVLYVGNFQNLPNVDALEYLMADIWPLVRLARPEATLTVVGAHASKRVQRFHGQHGVTVVGTVPDLRPHYHRHALMVAPIRAGSGTRLKILEAFAAGLPVVSTSLGAEGITCENERHLLVADPPAAFARAVVRLLDDRALGERLAAAALELAVERYDWRASADALLSSYRELRSAAASSGRTRPAAAARAAEAAAARRRGTPGGATRSQPRGVSVILPTLDGGERLAATLAAIHAQNFDRDLEVVCVDSGSSAANLEMMGRFPVRIERIDKSEFNHGLTRDLGAGLSRGEVLVFLNQDAVPCDEWWLRKLTEPLFVVGDPGDGAGGPGGLAAVQGGIRELPDLDERFYWDSCGHRFYFTRESDRWIDRFEGIGFSTVNAAIRRAVWERHPFGWAPIMEDKKWQREVIDAGYSIHACPDAAVFHTHNYDLRTLVRRCRSEGYGWSLLGEPYRLGDMVRDMLVPRVYRDLARGIGAGRVRSSAELFFPVLRPFMVYRGNRWSRDVEL